MRIPIHVDLLSHAPDATREVGASIGRLLENGQVVALCGDLGAGKTTLTQGIAQGFGVTQPVTSPTFTLVNEYPTRDGKLLIHIDLYRLGDGAMAESEAAAFGLEEMLDASDNGFMDGTTAIIIEWADRVAPMLPADHLLIQLSHAAAGEESRRIELVAFGPTSARLLSQLPHDCHPGAPCARQ